VKTSVTTGPHPAIERSQPRVLHEDQLLNIIVEAVVIPERKGDEAIGKKENPTGPGVVFL